MMISIKIIKPILIVAVQFLIAANGVVRASAQQLIKPVDAQVINRGRTTARALVNSRDYDQAIILLTDLREKAPQYHDFSELLATVYLKTMQPGKAAELLEKELEKTPGRTGFVTILGKAYLDLGMKEKAHEIWHSILDEKMAHPLKYGIIADMEWSEGLFEEAINTLQEGSRHEKYYQQAMRKLVKYKSILGDHKGAFRNGLAFLDDAKNPVAENTDFLFDSYRAAGRRENDLFAVDSLSRLSEKNKRYFKMIAALLRIESEIFDGTLDSVIEMKLSDREIFYFTRILFRMKQRDHSDAYHRFTRSLLNEFIGRDPDSPMVPQLLFSSVESSIKGNYEKAHYSAQEGDSVIYLLDKVIDHRNGSSYRKGAALLKAKFQLERLYRPLDAFATLSDIRFDEVRGIREAERIRAFSLLASGERKKAEELLARLKSHPDTNVAVLGRFVSGNLYFLKGDFEKSIELLSALAEEHPSSEWANDALERAMVCKKAIKNDKESLKIYASATELELQGKFGKAAAALGFLVNDHRESVLYSRAVYYRATLLEKNGEKEKAEMELLDFSENNPLDDYAPRALEKLGSMVEAVDPVAASVFLGQVLERYPEYPFISRIREKYIALKKLKTVDE